MFVFFLCIIIFFAGVSLGFALWGIPKDHKSQPEGTLRPAPGKDSAF